MPSPKIQHPVTAMSVEAASNYAANLIDLELSQTSGNLELALHRLEAKYGLSTNQLMHLRKRRAKSCDVSLFARLKGAYLDLCESQVRRLQQEIAIEKATAGDAFDEDLGRKVRELAAEVAARKAAR